MSTFLVTLTVVVLSIAGAVAIAVQDPAQPATARPPRRRTPKPAPAPDRAAVKGGSKRIAASNQQRHRTLQPVQSGPSGSPAPHAGRQAVHSGPATLPVTIPATVEITGLTEQWRTGPVGQSFWVRLRSGVVLTMLLALVGTLLAASIAGVIVALALAVRTAVS